MHQFKYNKYKTYKPSTIVSYWKKKLTITAKADNYCHTNIYIRYIQNKEPEK